MAGSTFTLVEPAQPAKVVSVLGNLLPSNLNSGIGADSTTYWRGDGTWVTPAGGGNVTGTSLTANAIVIGGGGSAISVLASLGTTGQFLQAQTGTTPIWSTPTMIPGGATTNVQYNDGGTLAGDAGFVYIKATGSATLGVSNTGATIVSVVNANAGALAQAQIWLGTSAGNLITNMASAAGGGVLNISSSSVGGTNFYTTGATALGLGTNNNSTRLVISSAGGVSIPGQLTPGSLRFTAFGGSATFQAPAAFGADVTYVLPFGPIDTYFLQTNGTGTLSWVAGATHTAGLLTANELIIGNAVADLKTLGSLGATTTFLQGNAAGAPTWATQDWVKLTTNQTVAGAKTLSDGINVGDFSWVNATNLHGGWNGGIANIWTYAGPTLTAGSFVIGAYYTILSAGSTNFTLIGAANNNVGTHFTATGVGSGTGTATGLIANWGIISGTNQSPGIFLVKDSGIGLTALGELTGSGAVWSMYMEGYKQASAGASGQLIGFEFDIINRYSGGTADNDPYTNGTNGKGITEGLRIGAGTLGSQVSYNISSAISIISNPDNGYGNPAVSFNKGIIFGTGAIAAGGDAIAFADGNTLQWYVSVAAKSLAISNGPAFLSFSSGAGMWGGNASFGTYVGKIKIKIDGADYIIPVYNP